MFKELNDIAGNLLNSKYKNVYIWGAGIGGKVFFTHFIDEGINITGFIDSYVASNNAKLFELPIFPPSVLESVDKKSTFIILALKSQEAYYEVQFKLKEMGFTEGVNFFDFVRFNIPHKWRNQKGVFRSRPLYENREEALINSYQSEYHFYADLAIKFHKIGKLADVFSFDLLESEYKDCFIRALSVAITRKCNLNCDQCMAFLEFESEKENFTDTKIDEIFDNVEKLTQVAYLFRLCIYGGEPLLHPNLTEILQKALAIPNVGIIEVFTNGTIIPKDELIQFLKKNPRIFFRIGNYTSVSEKVAVTTKNILKLFDENQICYYLSPNELWSEYTDFEMRDYDEKTLEHLLLLCSSFACCEIQGGKLFPCVVTASGDYIKAIPCNDIDYIDIKNTPLNELKQKINYIIKDAKSFPACAYCDSSYDLCVRTNPAEQLKHKRPYKKLC